MSEQPLLSRRLRDLHRWQKWILADQMLEKYQVNVLGQPADGGLTLGRGAMTVDLPGWATVEDAIKCAESGLLEVPNPANEPVPIVLVVLFWLVVVIGFAAALWLGGVFVAAEGAYHHSQGMGVGR
jgi:hypothetical protein